MVAGSGSTQQSARSERRVAFTVVGGRLTLSTICPSSPVRLSSGYSVLVSQTKSPVGHVYPGAAEQVVVVAMVVEYLSGHYWVIEIPDMMMSSILYVIEDPSPPVATGTCSAHLI